MGSKLDSFLRKKKVFISLFCSCCTVYIIRDNAKIFTRVGLCSKDIILFSKNFVFDVVYVKSNNISY